MKTTKNTDASSQYLNELRLQEILKKIEHNKNNVYLYENEYFEKFYKEMCRYFSHHNLPVEIKRIVNTDFLNRFLLDNKTYCPDTYIKIFDENLCNITILPNEKGIDLYRLEIYNQGEGVGSAFMNAFCNISKKTGIPIYLTPGDPGFNRSDLLRLKKFYSRFGFKKIERDKYWTNAYKNGKIRPFIGEDDILN